MSCSTCDDLGKLVLRLSLGIFLLLHGVAKLGADLTWLGNTLAAKGLPGFFAYGVYLGEVVAPVLIILGLFTRVGAAIAIINMLFVIGLVHAADLFTLGQSGGHALELQGLFLFGSVAILLLGAGTYSVGGRNGRYN
ncbi:DoxX family protein [Castellaniella sp.]|uniref:DoxX family protein n=1 Tax=Castellaniella sp. TaxID=1955812 RepID=UPI00355D37BB